MVGSARSFARFGAAVACAAAVFACADLLDVNDVVYAEHDAAGDAQPAPGDFEDAEASDSEPACAADLERDPENCGRCGHDCSGGRCEFGLCVLAELIASPSRLVVDERAVFFASSSGSGKVSSCAKNGCVASTPTMLSDEVSGNGSPADLRVTSTRVFWIDDGSNSAAMGLYSVGRDGKGLVHTAAEAADRLAISGSTLYWNVYLKGIRTCPTSGCPDGGASTLPRLPVDEDVRAIAAGPASTVYFSSHPSKISMCFDRECAGGVHRIGTASSPLVFELVLDDEYIVWAGSTRIEACRHDGAECLERPIVIAEETAIVTGIALRGDDVYWSVQGKQPEGTGNTIDGVVRTCRLPGCTPRDIAVGQAAPQGVAVDADSVYWTNGGRANSTGGVGSLMKAPR